MITLPTRILALEALVSLGVVVGGCTPDSGPSRSDASGTEAPATADTSNRPQDVPLPAAPGAPRASLNPFMADKIESVDAENDGWDTEVFTGEAKKVLHELGEHLDSSEDQPLRGLIVDDFACTPLRPAELEVVHEGSTLSVHRPASSLTEAEVSLSEAAGLASAIEGLRAAYSSSAHVGVKFKFVTVEPDEDSVRTQVYYQAHGEAASGVVFQNATWSCDWTLTTPLRLRSIRLEAFEESHAADGELFADCTEAVLGDNAAWEEQLLPHLENWLGSLQARIFSEFLGHQGIAIGDVNGDGLEDVYLCQAGGLPNRLFVQTGDGRAVDRSQAAGVDFLDPTRGALLVDADGDGDQDLLLSLSVAMIFLANDGDGNFERRWGRELPQIHSLSAADYDHDGDLDVYGCRYNIPDSDGAAPIPYHDANNGDPNVLLRNDGDWSFTDVTQEVGLDQNNRRYSFASSWEDFDNDGDLDLYVANDFGRNNLYRYDDGKFTDIAGQAGVEDISAGMSVSWGDYDNDGLMDAYVSNMFSSAGNRIAYNRRFHTDVDDETRSQFQRHARGNSLFKNAGDGTFLDASVGQNVTMGRWSWASKFVDLDNDGRQDIVVTNGLVTSDEPHDL